MESPQRRAPCKGAARNGYLGFNIRSLNFIFSFFRYFVIKLTMPKKQITRFHVFIIGLGFRVLDRAPRLWNLGFEIQV